MVLQTLVFALSIGSAVANVAVLGYCLWGALQARKALAALASLTETAQRQHGETMVELMGARSAFFQTQRQMQATMAEAQKAAKAQGRILVPR